MTLALQVFGLKQSTDDGARSKLRGLQVFTIHPEGCITVCAKFHDNPPHSCRKISLKMSR